MNGARAIVLLAVLALPGCERAMHDMYQQPKEQPLAPDAQFADGNSARTPPPGSVAAASGEGADSSGGHLGARPAFAHAGANQAHPLPITAALLERGRERFDIDCAPCHGRSGDGAGMVVQRGFPAPPDYHSARLRDAPDSHFYQVISHGYGVMYPYADRIVPEDRWAIVAYIRALQLSQHAPRDQLSVQDLARLQASSPSTGAKR